MARCVMRRGFFTLRDCGKRAECQCTECRRPMCPDCVRDMDGQRICLDCAAKTDSEAEDDIHERDWVYRRRHHYYESYSPIYYGRYRDRYYDDYDMRAFNQRDDDMVDLDDMADGGFDDS